MALSSKALTTLAPAKMETWVSQYPGLHKKKCSYKRMWCIPFNLSTSHILFLNWPHLYTEVK